MNADKVEHRGISAFQDICGTCVLLYKGNQRLARIRIDGRKTAAELESIIDEYLEQHDGLSA